MSKTVKNGNIHFMFEVCYVFNDTSITKWGSTVINLEKSVCMFEHPTDEGMSGLVVRDDLLLRRAEHVCLLLRSGNHALNRVFQIVCFHLEHEKLEAVKYLSTLISNIHGHKTLWIVVIHFVSCKVVCNVTWIDMCKMYITDKISFIKSRIFSWLVNKSL